MAQPVARGRYARFAVPTAPQNEFARAAKLLCSIAEDIADIFADLNERLSAVINGKAGPYQSDNTLDWINLWQQNANNDQWFDSDFNANQDHHFPQP